MVAQQLANNRTSSIFELQTIEQLACIENNRTSPLRPIKLAGRVWSHIMETAAYAGLTRRTKNNEVRNGAGWKDPIAISTPISQDN